MLSRSFFYIFLILTFAACSAGKQADNGGITAEDLVRHIKTLSSDEFEGRAPSTVGEEKTLAYLQAEFKRMGLKPGNGESYLQQVPLVKTTTVEKTPLVVTGGKQPLSFDYLEDTMVWTKDSRSNDAAIKDSELVFVGFGVIAPEYDWNDYEGIDVKGKTVVIMVNDPGYDTQDPKVFNGNAMTYYGRWSYKYEEAARQGAAAALIIHETGAAAYGWNVVQGRQRPLFQLDDPGNLSPKLALRGWVTNDTANQLLANVNLNYEQARKAALQKDFKAMPLNLKASMAIKTTTEKSVSHNVAAMLEGSQRADEVVIYAAHWDHLGNNPDREGEDKISNGAVDNATGTAALLEIAEKFTSLKPAPRRSVMFLAVTAEESGLLGSAYYATHPIYPLNSTVAVMNMDAWQSFGKTKDVVVVGHGNSELEQYLEKHAKTQGRYIAPEPSPEKGSFYRSDHFNFAKQGVPALYIHSGVDHVTHGKEYGLEKKKDYTANRYHQPSDEYSDDWDMSGIVQDAELFYAVGLDLASISIFPNWYPNNEFRAIRDQSRQDD